MLEMDVSEVEAREGDSTPQDEQPNKYANNVALEFETTPGPSRSRGDATERPLQTSQTHQAYLNLPITMYVSYKYMTTDEEEYGEKKPDKGSGDDEFLLERAIQAWNHGGTEQLNIFTSNNENAPMETDHVIAGPIRGLKIYFTGR